MYYFDKSSFFDIKDANSKNFVMGNGLGGLCSMSIINSTYRKQFGYLVASLNPPVNKMLILNKTREKVIIGDKTYDLDNQQYQDKFVDNTKYLEDFSFNYIPSFNYQVSKVSINKKICLSYGANTVAIAYEIMAKENADIIIEPLFNYREQGDVSDICDLEFEESYKNNIYTLIPKKNKDIKIKFIYSEGSLYQNDDKYTEPFFNEYDVETGDGRLDRQYKPFHIKINLKAFEVKYLSIIVTIDKLPNVDAFNIIDKNMERMRILVKKSLLNDSLAKNLVASGDSFICYRESTKLKTILAGLPWFSDWGRDTMIAFTGLTLVPRRFKEAKEILQSFAYYVKDGLIPNMFPTDNNPPIYNTADASLWYIYACYKYALYTLDYAFIKDFLFDKLKEIIKYYLNGTANNIHADKDYLIIAGDGLDQVTWMDVRVGDFVVTPRHGKPVEINALWYNALMIMSHFAIKFKEEDIYLDLAKKVYSSFRKKFYNAKTKVLYDVIDENDGKIRPNQLYAFSLPFKLYSKEEAKPIFEIISSKLYNHLGMRTLNKEDKDYKGKYEGELMKRDIAYHNGTTWPYLIGAYFDAYRYIYPERKEELKKMIYEFNDHLNEGCINGICEVLNGDDAVKSKGCYNQAWSVAEVLRSLYEDVLEAQDGK